MVVPTEPSEQRPCKDCGKRVPYVPRRSSRCPECRRARDRNYNKRTGYLKKRYARLTPEEREKKLEYGRKWYREHPDYCRQRRRAWNAKNKDKANASGRRRYRENIEHYRERKREASYRYYLEHKNSDAYKKRARITQARRQRKYYIAKIQRELEVPYEEALRLYRETEERRCARQSRLTN